MQEFDISSIFHLLFLLHFIYFQVLNMNPFLQEALQTVPKSTFPMVQRDGLILPYINGESGGHLETR